MIPNDWDLTSTIYNIRTEDRIRNEVEVMGT